MTSQDPITPGPRLDDDFELVKPADEPLPPEPSANPARLWIVAGVLIVAAAVAAYFLLRSGPPPAAVASAPAPVEQAPLGGPPSPVVVPPLDDSDAFVRDLLYGYGTPAKSIMIAPNVTFFNTDPAAALRSDPAKAQALAKEALAGGRTKVTLAFTPPGEGISAWPYSQMAAYLQATLKPLGFDVELKQMEAAALTDARNQGEFDLVLANNCWATGDPNYILGRLLHSKAALNTTQKQGYNNPEVDKLIDQARVTTDPAAQKKLYDRVEQIAANEFPLSPLFDQQTVIAARPFVKGLSQRIAYAPTFETVYLVKR